MTEIGMVCSCGYKEPHVIASQQTADGLRIDLWSTGAITGPLGYKVPGVPMASPRTNKLREEALAIGLLFVGDLELYNRDELEDWYKACRWTSKRGGLPGDARARFWSYNHATIRPAWDTVIANRYGVPTERFWRLPRLRWPGLAVFDFCGGPGSKNGRYVLYRLTRNTVSIYQSSNVEAWEPTGFAFVRLSDLFRHLDNECPGP